MPYCWIVYTTSYESGFLDFCFQKSRNGREKKARYNQCSIYIGGKPAKSNRGSIPTRVKRPCFRYTYKLIIKVRFGPTVWLIVRLTLWWYIEELEASFNADLEPDRNESDHGSFNADLEPESDHGYPNNETTSSSDMASQTQDNETTSSSDKASQTQVNESTSSFQLPVNEQGPSGIQTGQRGDLKMVLRNRGSGRVKFRSIESKLWKIIVFHPHQVFFRPLRCQQKKNIRRRACNQHNILHTIMTS